MGIGLKIAVDFGQLGAQCVTYKLVMADEGEVYTRTRARQKPLIIRALAAQKW
jgi:hypothetical protein